MSTEAKRQTATDVLILIATQSFTAESYVEDILLEKLQDAGLSMGAVEAKFVDEVFDVSLSSLQQQQQQQQPAGDENTGNNSLLHYANVPSPPVLLFVVSTFGNGDPPNHATEFADWLHLHCTHKKDEQLLKSFQYAVFALGDRTYANYAAFGLFVDKSMSMLGATRIHSLATGDASQSGGDQEGEFIKWCDDIVGALRMKCKHIMADTSAERLRRNPQKDATQEGLAFFSRGATGADWRRSSITADSVVAQVVEARELMDCNNDRSMRSVVHVSLRLPSSSVPNDIKAGDHVGVYARNDPVVVQRALDWLGLEASTLTTILVKSSDRTWVPREITCYNFLSQHIDLTGKATPATLRAFLPFVGTLELRALARELTHVDTTSGGSSKEKRRDTDASQQDPKHRQEQSAFEEWVGGRRLTALDLAVLFECRPSVQAFARACGPLQPRLYSLATVQQEHMSTAPCSSCSGKRKDEIDTITMDDGSCTANTTTKLGLCVAVVPGGLCSNYMATLGRNGIGQQHELTIFHRKSGFRLENDGKPTLLIAAGSGIGVCIGFMEQKIAFHNGVACSTVPPLSDCRLFFGCRTPSETLYGHELSTYTSVGLQVHYAFSRVPGQPKTYVQDLIRKEAQVVWNEVFHKGGRVYVCGRLELLSEVKAALLDVAKFAGGLDDKAALLTIKAYEEADRLRTDCWSVETKGDKFAIGQQQKAKKRQHVILRLERHHTREEWPHHHMFKQDLSTVPDWPSYLRLMASGELEHRVKRAMDMWSACVACGRYCEVNRLSKDPSDWGECRVGCHALVSSAFPHFGEEDCLVGTNGSGTIFFGACNLKCMYCQNWELSAMDEGEYYDDERLAKTMLNLQKRKCHNINFVSPTHNVAPILRALLIAAQRGLHLPLVWNTGGYDSVASLRLLDGVIDIYMPDAKYASRAVARKLSRVDNYPEINQAAIKEMHRQVGELQLDSRGLARRGVLVRHLILPCHLAGTCDVMSFLAKEVSKRTFTNVMDQYRPEHKALGDGKFGLGRRPTRKELNEAHEEAHSSGLSRFDGEERWSLQW